MLESVVAKHCPDTAHQIVQNFAMTLAAIQPRIGLKGIHGKAIPTSCFGHFLKKHKKITERGLRNL